MRPQIESLCHRVPPAWTGAAVGRERGAMSNEERIRNRCQRATFVSPACEPRAVDACPMCRVADTYVELLAIAQALDDLDWCIGYELTEANSEAIDAAQLRARAVLLGSGEAASSGGPHR
jgi:hypothetical protein